MQCAEPCALIIAKFFFLFLVAFSFTGADLACRSCLWFVLLWHRGAHPGSLVMVRSCEVLHEHTAETQAYEGAGGDA